jgi:ArsR family transcriptional regulator, arsenate/arsenite/antimonite-responsive transcriptional repressor
MRCFIEPLCAATGRENRRSTDRYASQFKAVADPTRRAMLACLIRVGEICVADLTEPFPLSQPTISHHLRLLREAGLLETTGRGALTFYSVPPAALERLQSALVDACLQI